ncbi:MAG TPA: hypothetical protein VGF56_08845 [Rhizomicrobium sp.]|jgi:hypothetical protein
MDFLHDIFISYPSTLNKTPYAGWIFDFENGLKNAFEDHAKEFSQPDIYLDYYKVEANSIHDDMLEKARRSRLFLAIISPDYQERAWAPKELAAFAAECKDRNRLFVIATKPLPENEIRLDSLKGRPIKAFYTKSPSAMGQPTPFHPSSREFQDGVYALAYAMAAKLMQMRGNAKSDSPRPEAPTSLRNTSPASASARTILIAQVTDDLEKDARSVISELQQECNDGTLNIIDANAYPSGGDSFREAFEADLKQAQLVVQLLSGFPGKHPRNLTEGYVAYQANRAAQCPGVRLMQWRRSNIDVKAVEDDAHRELLQAETVTASTLSTFKDDLVKWIKSPKETDTPDSQDASLTGLQVFINAEAVDLSAAQQCRDAVADMCASVWLPPQGNPASESIQKELERLLQDCDSLLFFNGGAGSAWVSSQLRQAVKVRVSRRLAMRGAVCEGPPLEKEELHGIVNGVERVICSTPDGSRWQFEAVRNFLRKTAGGMQL